MTKSPSIDMVKGLLILLVMAGHAMELTHQQHVLLWVGAGFRMALIIGISGYLLNVPRTRTDSSAAFYRRYTDRMLLPWAVALLAYVLISGWRIDWTAPLTLLLRPPFHLWYVPVLFLLIVMTRLLPFRPIILLVIGVPISLATMYSFGLEHGPIGTGWLSFDNRYVRYPVYIFFGMLMAERGLQIRYLGVVLLLTALGMGWWALLYGSDNSSAFVSARLIMCLGLISLLPLIAARRLYFAPLNAIGRDSLFFYLWHPLIMGLVLMSVADAAILMAVSVLLLTLASMLTVRQPMLRRLSGSATPHRPASIPEFQPPLAVGS